MYRPDLVEGHSKPYTLTYTGSLLPMDMTMEAARRAFKCTDFRWAWVDIHPTKIVTGAHQIEQSDSLRPILANHEFYGTCRGRLVNISKSGLVSPTKGTIEIDSKCVISWFGGDYWEPFSVTLCKVGTRDYDTLPTYVYHFKTEKVPNQRIVIRPQPFFIEDEKIIQPPESLKEWEE